MKSKRRIQIECPNLSIAFIILLGIQLALFFIAAMMKDGFNIDDILSYLLANSYYQPYLEMLPDFYNTWHDTNYFMEALTITNESSRFMYRSVTYNQIQDVHPPLYYYALHTVSSIFKGAFSKWFGLGLNFLFFIGASVLLYKITSLFLKPTYLRLLPLIIWGFSIGAFSTLLLIRMYMMLCFVTLLYYYIHLRLISGKQLNLWRIAVIIATILIGFLTHYYFLGFAFFVVASECLVRLFKKDYIQMLSFGIVSSVAVLLGFVIYPAAYSHIFSGYQGNNSFSNFFNFANYGAMLTQLSGTTSLANWLAFLIALLALVCLAVACFVPRIASALSTVAETFYPQDIACLPAQIFMLCFTAFGAFFTVAMLGGYTTERYLFAIYPILALVLGLALAFLFSALPIRSGKQQLCAVLVALCLVGTGWYHNTPMYLDSESAAAIASAKEYSDTPCIIVLVQPYQYVGHFIELSSYQKTMLVKSTEIYNLADTVEEITDETLILYLPKGSDTTDYTSYFEENYDFTQFEFLWSYAYSDVYKLSK